MATKSLYQKESLFDVEPDGLNTFMSRLSDRARDLQFTLTGRIGLVPEDAAANSPTVNIFESYGTRSLMQITEFERTFLANNDRNSQDSKILYDLLMGSITVTGQQRLANQKGSFNLEIAGTSYQAGLCLLKLIIQESYLDSTATVNTTRYRLSSLDSWVQQNGSDITALNAHINGLINVLNARGETTEDLLANVLKGYKACKDARFKDYILHMENNHDDQTAPITARLFMTRADNYYRKRLTNKQDPWEVNEIADQLQALKVQFAAKQQGTKPAPSPTGPRQKNTKRPEWLHKHKRPPQAELNKAKSWNGKTWYYCHPDTGGKCEGAWRLHHPSDCKGTARKRAATGTGKPDPKKPRKGGRQEKAQLIAAQEAKIQADQTKLDVLMVQTPEDPTSSEEEASQATADSG